MSYFFIHLPISIWNALQTNVFVISYQKINGKRSKTQKKRELKISIVRREPQYLQRTIEGLHILLFTLLQKEKYDVLWTQKCEEDKANERYNGEFNA